MPRQQTVIQLRYMSQLRFSIPTATCILIAGMFLSATALASDTRSILDPNPNLETLCENLSVIAEGEEVAISNLTVYRGPFDFGGTRLAGCITNRGEDTIEHFVLYYGLVIPRTRGVGNARAHVAAVHPGETQPFVTNVYSTPITDAATGIRLASVEAYLGPNRVQKRMRVEATRDFPRTELPLPPAALSCEPVPAGEDDARVYLHDVTLIQPEFALDGMDFLVGCVTNHTDRPLAADGTPIVYVRYLPRPPQSRFDELGHTERLRVFESVAPGEASVFISQFSLRLGARSMFEGVDEFDIQAQVPNSATYGPSVNITRDP